MMYFYERPEDTAGSRIKYVREYTGLSQTEFAKKINKARTTLSQIERDIYDVTDATLKDIAEQFHVNIDWLRYGVGDWKADVEKTSIKDNIRIYLVKLDNIPKGKRKRKANTWDIESSVSYGYEDLNIHNDMMKLSYYQQNNSMILDNTNYRVVKRYFRPEFPMMLAIYLEREEMKMDER